MDWLPPPGALLEDGDQIHNPGVWAGWGIKPKHLSALADALTTEKNQTTLALRSY